MWSKEFFVYIKRKTLYCVYILMGMINQYVHGKKNW